MYYATNRFGKAADTYAKFIDTPVATEDDILILDPESEFGSLVEALNGEVITISATSNTHLNALDMESDADLDIAAETDFSEFEPTE